MSFWTLELARPDGITTLCPNQCNTWRPGHKGHDDLTSSSPPPDLSPAVGSWFQSQWWQLNTRAVLVAGLNPTPNRTS